MSGFTIDKVRNYIVDRSGASKFTVYSDKIGCITYASTTKAECNTDTQTYLDQQLKTARVSAYTHNK
jgi:hypothetical protein